MEFRKLKVSEIETRAQSVKEKGAVFLLYKDARCDMNILDETVGPENWQRKHDVVNGNLFCEVSIWDKDKKQWISKQDVGVESRTEKEKGQASDAFKRACFNWGIGRELYTSPFIWINLKSDETYKSGKNVRINNKVNFKVSSIEYDDEGRISDLEITDQDDNLRYKMGEYIPANNQKKKTKDTTKKKLQPSKTTIIRIKELKEIVEDAGDEWNDETKNFIGDMIKNYNKDKVDKLADEEYEEMKKTLKTTLKADKEIE